MQKENSWHARGAINAMEFQEIAVGSGPPLQAGGRGRLPTKEFPPQCLQMPAGNPPCGRIDYVSAHYGFSAPAGHPDKHWKCKSSASKKMLIRERHFVSSQSGESKPILSISWNDPLRSASCVASRRNLV